MKATLDDHKMKMTAKMRTLNIKMIYKIKTVTKMNTEEMKITSKNKGSLQIKKCPKLRKKSKRGGSAQKIKKSKIQNLDFLIRGG